MYFAFTVYPHIIKDRFIQNVLVQAPECFTLSVEFMSACDNITVAWQFNEKYITNNDDNYMININNIKRSHYKTSLQIKQSSENDAGNYTVTVTSTTGSDRVNISVRIISKLLYSYLCKINNDVVCREFKFPNTPVYFV